MAPSSIKNCLIAFAVFAASATSLQAGVFDLLDFDGVEDPITDQSWANLVDGGTVNPATASISSGDRIYGLVQVDKVDSKNANFTVWAIFSFTVDRVTDSGGTTKPAVDAGGDIVDLVPTSELESDSVKSLLGTKAPSFGSWSHVAIAVLDVPLTQSEGQSLVDDLSNGIKSVTDAISTLTSKPGTTVRALLGFDPADPDQGFIQSTAVDTPPTGDIDFFLEKFGLYVLYTDPTMPSSWFLPVKPFTDFRGNTITNVQFATGKPDAPNESITISFTGRSGPDAAYFTDDGNMRVNPTPEPGTLALLGLGFATGALAARRRHRRACIRR